MEREAGWSSSTAKLRELSFINHLAPPGVTLNLLGIELPLGEKPNLCEKPGQSARRR
jgi:hypothetical protein